MSAWTQLELVLDELTVLCYTKNGQKRWSVLSMSRIRFLCHGSICRSPMAEFVMKFRLQYGCGSQSIRSKVVFSDNQKNSVAMLQQKCHDESRGIFVGLRSGGADLSTILSLNGGSEFRLWQFSASLRIDAPPGAGLWSGGACNAAILQTKGHGFCRVLFCVFVRQPCSSRMRALSSMRVLVRWIPS